MFLGNFPLKVDGKNRVVVPPLFREILNQHYTDDNNNVVMTISMEKTIAVYPTSSFDSYSDKLMQRPQFKSNVRALTNTVTMSSSIEKLDSAGKIALKDFIKRVTGIDKDVYVVGCGDHFEIWPKERFEDYINKHIQQLSELGDKMDQ